MKRNEGSKSRNRYRVSYIGVIGGHGSTQIEYKKELRLKQRASLRHHAAGSHAASSDEEQDRKWVQARTPFVCSLCKYPALATWKFCPHCGGLLEWKSVAAPSSK